MRKFAMLFALAVFTSSFASYSAPAGAESIRVMIGGPAARCGRHYHWVGGHRDRWGHWVAGHCRPN